MSDLAQRRCQACEGGVLPLGRQDAEGYLAQVVDWQLAEDGLSIAREVVCANFVAAVGLINRIKDIAEAEDHHPDLHLTGYKRLRIELSTHAIGGLSENDFICAAKFDSLVV